MNVTFSGVAVISAKFGAEQAMLYSRMKRNLYLGLHFPHLL